MLFIIIIIIILLISFFYYKENFKGGFILDDLPIIEIIRRPVNTPLTRLYSPYKKFAKGEPVSNFLICNPTFLSPVRDQKNCGGCWAYVITSMLSERITINFLKYINNFNAQQLLNCYDNGKGCDGEKPENVIKWMADTNFKLDIVNNDFMPITPCILLNEGIEVKPDSMKSLCVFVENETKLSIKEQEIINQNIYNMKRELHTKGPFFATMSVYSDFYELYDNELYIKKKDATFVGGHAVLVVGWCDKGVDIRKNFKDYGYWICKNSWGPNWPVYDNPKQTINYGLRGYFTIVMGSNMCGIESRCGTCEPDTVSNDIGNILAYTNYDKYFKDRLEHKIRFN